MGKEQTVFFVDAYRDKFEHRERLFLKTVSYALIAANIHKNI